MLVVADSGPIISLALIGKLDLLETLYGEVCISERSAGGARHHFGTQSSATKAHIDPPVSFLITA
jgi:predicted nucleic acid-binding protein